MKMQPEKNKSPNEIFDTVIDILRWRGNNESAAIAYQFLDDSRDWQSLTYQELDRRARVIGGLLQSIGAKGDRVLLFLIRVLTISLLFLVVCMAA